MRRQPGRSGHAGVGEWVPTKIAANKPKSIARSPSFAIRITTMSDTPNTPDFDKNVQTQAAYPVTDRVREAMAVSLRGCEELIPEADWLKKLEAFLAKHNPV